MIPWIHILVVCLLLTNTDLLFGYMTTGTGRYTRNNLYNETLYRAVDIVADKIKDARLVDELLVLS